MKQEPRTIVFLVTKSNWGGAQRYVYDLVTRLPDSYAPTVLFGGTGVPGSSAGALETKLAERNIPSMHLPSLGRDIHLIQDVRSFFELIRTLNRIRPDTIHLNSSKAGGIGALAARIAGVRNIVFTSHGLPYDEDRSLFARFGIFLATWITFALCHKVICISHDTYERAHRLFLVGHKVRFVRNGIDVFPLMPRDEARTHIAASHSVLQKDTLWVGTIAELVRNKGLSYALDAFAHMQGLRPAFVVIGEGDERTNLERQIARAHLESSCVLAGFQKDAREMLHAFDIFILPSVKEGLPYTLLEAGLARLPVVATRIPGVEDIIEHGVTGLLVPPQDSDALSTAIARLRDDEALRARLSGALFEKVRAHFSTDGMLAGTLAVYSESTGRR